MLVNGKIAKSSINLAENQVDKSAYYHLIGKAYNTHALDRETLPDSKKGNAFYTYIVDGEPKQLPHTDENDKKYAYAKLSIGGKDNKLFSTNCAKLKYNMGDQRRIDDCYYANGWFIVENKGLLKDVFSNKIEDCGVQMVQVESQEAQT